MRAETQVQIPPVVAGTSTSASGAKRDFMGSLMSGWNAPAHDPNIVKHQRNKSLTRAEIEAYWKSNKKTEEDLGEVSSPVNMNQENIYKGSEDKLQRSASLPLTDRRGSILNSSSIPDAEKFNQMNRWWTRSNWAFLNEPPVTAMEGPSYKYASQYHVAKFGRSNTLNNSEIRT